jgi:hypothetical protein
LTVPVLITGDHRAGTRARKTMSRPQHNEVMGDSDGLNEGLHL